MSLLRLPSNVAFARAHSPTNGLLLRIRPWPLKDQWALEDEVHCARMRSDRPIGCTDFFQGRAEDDLGLLAGEIPWLLASMLTQFETSPQACFRSRN